MNSYLITSSLNSLKLLSISSLSCLLCGFIHLSFSSVSSISGPSIVLLHFFKRTIFVKCVSFISFYWVDQNKRITGETIFNEYILCHFAIIWGSKTVFRKASFPTKIKYIFFTTEWALKTYFFQVQQNTIKNLKIYEKTYNLFKYCHIQLRPWK